LHCLSLELSIARNEGGFLFLIFAYGSPKFKTLFQVKQKTRSPLFRMEQKSPTLFHVEHSAGLIAKSIGKRICQLVFQANR